MSLKGRVAIITGGGRGIGAAAAKLLASRGAKVVVNYAFNSETAENVVKDIDALGGQALAIQADVRDNGQIEDMIKKTMETFGRIDILVNNANMRFAFKPFSEMTWDEFSQKLNDELKTTFEMTKAVIPIMKEQKFGRIINIASGLAKNPGPGFIAHGTAKAGLVGFTKYIAQELGPYGITANIVSPGLVETDATAHQPEEMKRKTAEFTPLKRVAEPEDVAGVIAFYASEDSKFMTGVYTPVNGGLQME